MDIFLTHTIVKWLRNKATKILMFGLSNSGKKTIAHKFRFDEYTKTETVYNFSYLKFQYNDISFDIIDVDGNYIHQLHKELFKDIDGLIFVLDSSDQNRMDEARNFLFKFVNEKDWKNSFLLILANKQDLNEAINSKKIIDTLELNQIKNHEWKIQECCAITGDGLLDGIKWICEQINNKKSKSYQF